MAEKQTICPNCATTYKVTVTQLTVAQGMVCCPKCGHNFNALLHLVKSTSIESDKNLSVQSFETKDQLEQQPEIENSVSDIFKRKAEHSNIDLKTYLNNLNYFNNEPITNIPSLNLSQGHYGYNQNDLAPKSKIYYLVWGLINFALLTVLLFQIVWFNPNLVDRYPIINTLFTKTCAILNCETIDQRYKQVKVNNIKVKSIDRTHTLFTGQINNQYSKSLELPNIKVSLKANNAVIKTTTIFPNEYLIDSLQGIKRIPQNSPYPFKFVIEQPRNTFDQYELDIIHP